MIIDIFIYITHRAAIKKEINKGEEDVTESVLQKERKESLIFTCTRTTSDKSEEINKEILSSTRQVKRNMAAKKTIHIKKSK